MGILLKADELARELQQELLASVASSKSEGYPPTLAVLLAGHDPASRQYAEAKRRAAEKLGIGYILKLYPAEVQEAELLADIDAFNADASVHGILLELPLPPHLTVCHSRTPDLTAHLSRADIVITAAGRPGLIQPAMVHQELVLVDAGISEQEDGRIAGDVHPDSVHHVQAVSPVPGGVGSLTTLMIYKNVIQAIKLQRGK